MKLHALFFSLTLLLAVGCAKSNSPVPDRRATPAPAPTPPPKPKADVIRKWGGHEAKSGLTHRITWNETKGIREYAIGREVFSPNFLEKKELRTGQHFWLFEAVAKGENGQILSSTSREAESQTVRFSQGLETLSLENEFEFNGIRFSQKDDPAEKIQVPGEFQVQEDQWIHHPQKNSDPTMSPTFEMTGKYDFRVLLNLQEGDESTYIAYASEISAARNGPYSTSLHKANEERLWDSLPNGKLLRFQKYKLSEDGIFQPTGHPYELYIPILDLDPNDIQATISYSKPMNEAIYDGRLRVQLPFAPEESSYHQYVAVQFYEDANQSGVDTRSVRVALNSNGLEGHVRLIQGQRTVIHMEVDGRHRRFRKTRFKIFDERIPIFQLRHKNVKLSCSKTETGYRIRWELPQPFAIRFEHKNSRGNGYVGPLSLSDTKGEVVIERELLDLFPLRISYVDPENGELMPLDGYPNEFFFSGCETKPGAN